MIVLIVLLLIISIIIFLWQASNIISIISGSLYVKADLKVIKKALELGNINAFSVIGQFGSCCGLLNLSKAQRLIKKYKSNNKVKEY